MRANNPIVLFGVTFALFALIGAQAAIAACKGVRFEGLNYFVCNVDSEKSKLEIFNLDKSDEPFRYFSSLATELSREGKTLSFAMNAGMFDENQRPIGLYIEDGKQAKKLNRRNGGGNFHLKPNGVFFIKDGKPGVLETEAYAKANLSPDFASQSGPMLVIDRKIHPKFSATGISRKIRNGVGVTATGDAIFVLSQTTVTFYEFAKLFRDGLNAENALFFDGTVSGLYAADLNRSDGFFPLGPMVGAFEMQ